MQSLSILNHDLEPTSLSALEALEYPASPRDIPAQKQIASGIRMLVDRLEVK